MDKDGFTHVLKDREKFPRKFIDRNKHTLQLVKTHFRLPDVIKVINLIHETMDKNKGLKEAMSDSDEDWFERMPAEGMSLKIYKRAGTRSRIDASEEDTEEEEEASNKNDAPEDGL